MLEKVYLGITDKELNEVIDKIVSNDNKHNRHKASRKLVNEVSGRKKARTAKLKGKNVKGRLGSRCDHFSNSLGGELSADSKDDNVKQIFQTYYDSPFTMDEYEALNNIKIGKAAGPEGISPEVLKYCDLDETVLQFANRLPMNLDEPVQWSESNLVPIPKSGNLSQVSNYMGISLSQIMLKVVNRIISNRIQLILAPLLRTNQNGFRPGRSSTNPDTKKNY